MQAMMFLIGFITGFLVCVAIYYTSPDSRDKFGRFVSRNKKPEDKDRI